MNRKTVVSMMEALVYDVILTNEMKSGSEFAKGEH